MKKITALILTLFAFISSGIMNVTGNRNIVPAAEAKEYSQVNALHILVPTKKEAVEIRKEILNNAKNPQDVLNNFQEAAKKYSTCPSGKSGGSLGWFGKGVMVPEFEKAAFSLPNGQVSEPIKTQFGWHLIYDVAKN